MGGVPTAIALPNTGIGLQSTTSVLAFVGGLVVPASPRPIFARLDISEKPETKEKKKVTPLVDGYATQNHFSVTSVVLISRCVLVEKI